MLRDVGTDNIVFSRSEHDGYGVSCLVYLTWFAIANKIFIFYDAFDDQYGTADDEDRPVVELLQERKDSSATLESPLL
jgi:hypothetical protein